jgi:hypothetical protein
MLDEQIEAENSSVEKTASSFQTTLFELFFVTTLIAVAIGVFLNVSEILAVFIGGAVMVYAAAKIWPPANPVVGAVRGFVAATLIGWGLFLLGFGDPFARFSFIVFLPPLGYITGFWQSETQHLE